MISSSFLNKIYKAGDVAFQINYLYDKKLNGQKTSILIDYGEVSIDESILFQEKRLSEMMLEIQKGFKSHLNID